MKKTLYVSYPYILVHTYISRLSFLYELVSESHLKKMVIILQDIENLSLSGVHMHNISSS